MDRLSNYLAHNSAPSSPRRGRSIVSERSIYITPWPTSHTVQNDTVCDSMQAPFPFPDEREAVDSLSGHHGQLPFREFGSESIHLVEATGHVQESPLFTAFSSPHSHSLVSGGSSYFVRDPIRVTTLPQSAARPCPCLASYFCPHTWGTEDEQTETSGSTHHVPPQVLIHENSDLPLFSAHPADAFQELASGGGFSSVVHSSALSTWSEKPDIRAMEHSSIIRPEPPCIPHAIRTLNRAANSVVCDHPFGIPLPLIPEGFALDKDDHVWMMNEILTSVLTLSEPLLLNVYRLVARHPYGVICFERDIGVANKPVLAIAMISALADWKRRHEDLGRLDRMDLCSQADDIREFLFSHRFLEHAQVVTHQQGPPNTVFMQHGPPLPDFTLKLTELYVLAADAYLESVMSGAPNVLSVSFRIQTLVGKLLKHLNAFEGAMGERERKLLKFPFFVAITMMTSELAPQVRECFRLLEAPPCKKAMKEISNLALALVCKRQSQPPFDSAGNQDIPPVTWRDVVFASLGSRNDEVPPICDTLWI